MCYKAWCGYGELNASSKYLTFKIDWQRCQLLSLKYLYDASQYENTKFGPNTLNDKEAIKNFIFWNWLATLTTAAPEVPTSSVPVPNVHVKFCVNQYGYVER